MFVDKPRLHLEGVSKYSVTQLAIRNRTFVILAEAGIQAF
jgi:hypothetical protein